MQKTIAKIALAATLLTSFAFALPALASVNITTNAATAITASDAMLNATNGAGDAIGHSFWVSLAPFSTASPSIPAGVYSTIDLGPIASNTPFSALLSSATGMPAVMSNTTYYFAAWSNVGGTWYPGEILSFTTAPAPLLGTLSAEDFGVVNYDTGLGILKGYTAGFGVADNTFASTTSVVVKLYAAGDVLLQTNTAILPKFNADITGTQFSSPFDVSGTFNYVTDGYWTNVRESEYGQSVSAVKVVATVTLANGKIVTAENTNLTGDPTTIFPPPPAECDINATQTIVSDTTTNVNGSNPSVATYNLHPSWVLAGTLGSGATWIWDAAQVANPLVAQTDVFTKTFNISGAVNSANIQIATDNGYILKVNGNLVIDKLAEEFNYGATVSYNVASLLHSGSNTLEVTVKNFALAGSTYQTNPAGLLYKLTINSNECENPPTPPANVSVHIFKYIDGVQATAVNANNADFPMLTTFNSTTYGNAIDAPFTLGLAGWGSDPAYQASFPNANVGADYATHEVTGGSVVGSSCETRQPFALAGYSVGNTLVAAQAAAPSLTIPSFTNLQGDKYVIVRNITCETPPQSLIKVHILKYLNGVKAVTLPGNYQFPMTATWMAANLNGGLSTSGNYVLGNNHGGAPDLYGADTSPMSTPANYTTSEVVGGQIVASANQCASGKYLLGGYRTSSVSFADAATHATTTAPVFTGLTSDRYVIVDNSKCPASNDNGNDNHNGDNGNQNGDNNNHNGNDNNGDNNSGGHHHDDAGEVLGDSTDWGGNLHQQFLAILTQYLNLLQAYHNIHH